VRATTSNKVRNKIKYVTADIMRRENAADEHRAKVPRITEAPESVARMPVTTDFALICLDSSAFQTSTRTNAIEELKSIRKQERGSRYLLLVRTVAIKRPLPIKPGKKVYNATQTGFRFCVHPEKAEPKTAPAPAADIDVATATEFK
jgi:hypothetical protein